MLRGNLAVEHHGQGPDPLGLVFTAHHHDGVGAFVRDDAELVFINPLARLSLEGKCCLDDGFDLFGIRVFKGNQRDLLADARHVNRLDDTHQPFDVGLDIGNDQGVGRRIGQNDTALGNQGCKEPFDFFGIGKRQGDDLGDHLVIDPVEFVFELGFDVAGAGIGHGDDLGDLTGIDNGKAVNFQHRSKDAIGFVHRYL